MNERPSGSSVIQSRSDVNSNLDEFMISFVSNKANTGDCLCCRWSCWLVILLSLADIHIQLTIIKFKVYTAPSPNPSQLGRGPGPTTVLRGRQFVFRHSLFRQFWVLIPELLAWVMYLGKPENCVTISQICAVYKQEICAKNIRNMPKYAPILQNRYSRTAMSNRQTQLCWSKHAEMAYARSV